MVEEPTVLEVPASVVQQGSPSPSVIPTSTPGLVDVAAMKVLGSRVAGSAIGPAPVLPLSALVTVVLDWLWFMIEVPQTISVVLLPTLLPASIVLGLICATVVTFVQRFIARDDWGIAVTKGFVMGVFAGVPYPVVGTTFGVLLLAWAGIHARRAN